MPTRLRFIEALTMKLPTMPTTYPAFPVLVQDSIRFEPGWNEGMLCVDYREHGGTFFFKTDEEMAEHAKMHFTIGIWAIAKATRAEQS